jgi:peptidoglycan/LPS O-acetylase OafA/YrhL
VGFFVVQQAVAAGAVKSAPCLAVAASVSMSDLFYHAVERPAVGLSMRLSTSTSHTALHARVGRST